MKRTPIVAITLALLGMSLAGCSKSAPDPAPVEAEGNPQPADQPSATAGDPPAPAPPVLPTTAASPLDANAVDAAPVEVAPAPDEQVMDDASATGMTARASRDEAAGNDARPAEQLDKD